MPCSIYSTRAGDVASPVRQTEPNFWLKQVRPTRCNHISVASFKAKLWRALLGSKRSWQASSLAVIYCSSVPRNMSGAMSVSRQ